MSSAYRCPACGSVYGRYSQWDACKKACHQKALVKKFGVGDRPDKVRDERKEVE